MVAEDLVRTRQWKFSDEEFGRSLKVDMRWPVAMTRSLSRSHLVKSRALPCVVIDKDHGWHFTLVTLEPHIRKDLTDEIEPYVGRPLQTGVLDEVPVSRLAIRNCPCKVARRSYRLCFSRKAVVSSKNRSKAGVPPNRT